MVRDQFVRKTNRETLSERETEWTEMAKHHRTISTPDIFSGTDYFGRHAPMHRCANCCTDFPHQTNASHCSNICRRNKRLIYFYGSFHSLFHRNLFHLALHALHLKLATPSHLMSKFNLQRKGWKQWQILSTIQWVMACGWRRENADGHFWLS